VFWTVALVGQALLGDGAFALRPSRASERNAQFNGVYAH
jgi:hypothetical protein